MKKGILTWFTNQKLGKKIIYTFFVAAVLPLIVAQGLMLYVITGNMKKKVDILMTNQLEQISERTKLTVDIYTNLVYQIYSDNDIIKNIGNYRKADMDKKVQAYRGICDRLQQYGTSATGIECISIILPDGKDISYDFGLASAVDNLWKDTGDKTELKPYKKAVGSANIVISPTERFLRDGKELRVFHLSKKMYDFADISKGTIAIVIMSINESVLKQTVSAETDKGEGVSSINFITDKEGNIITYPNSFYAGISLDPKKTIKEFVKITGELTGKNNEVNIYEDEVLGWKFYNVYDEDYIFKDVNYIQYLTIGIGGVLFLISIMMILYTVRLIEKSTDSVMTGIKKVQRGELDVYVSVESKDEIGQIAENFNTMTAKVRELIKEITEASEKQRKAEIKALEAQIDPHFLYNTLDSINWMAIEKEEYEISNMLRNLGLILRYSVNKSNHMATVAEMADWLDKYISLQKMRFNDAFSYEIHVDKKVEKIKLHKLLLQPFVENSILHGFKEMKSGGMLRVDFMLSEDERNINVIIEDNGKGIESEILSKYNDNEMAVKDDSRSIGMQNAFARLRIYYGEAASWNVSSIEGAGTVITLRIPVEQQENKAV